MLKLEYHLKVHFPRVPDVVGYNGHYEDKPFLDPNQRAPSCFLIGTVNTRLSEKLPNKGVTVVVWST